MGIGSFFSSLFQKEDAGAKEIREIKVEKEEKELSSPKRQDKPRESARIEEAASGKAKESKTADDSRGEEGESARPRKRKEASDRPRGRREASGESGRNKPTAEKSEGVMRESEEADRPGKEEAEKAKAARKEYYQAKKDLYHYLNQVLKAVHEADLNGSYETLLLPEGLPQSAADHLDRIREELPENLKALMEPFLANEFRADPSGLKPAYMAMMLPFYPAYRQELAELKFNTLLNRSALELFRRLTGRKFRLGYRNQYSTGVTAFEWKGDRYKVYNKKGMLLCDATFEDGAVKNGYAVEPQEGGEDADWDVLKKGRFVDGQFTEGAVEYVYRKPVGLV